MGCIRGLSYRTDIIYTIRRPIELKIIFLQVFWLGSLSNELIFSFNVTDKNYFISNKYKIIKIRLFYQYSSVHCVLHYDYTTTFKFFYHIKCFIYLTSMGHYIILLVLKMSFYIIKQPI